MSKSGYNSIRGSKKEFNEFIPELQKIISLLEGKLVARLYSVIDYTKCNQYVQKSDSGLTPLVQKSDSGLTPLIKSVIKKFTHKEREDKEREDKEREDKEISDIMDTLSSQLKNVESKILIIDALPVRQATWYKNNKDQAEKISHCKKLCEYIINGEYKEFIKDFNLSLPEVSNNAKGLEGFKEFESFINSNNLSFTRENTINILKKLLENSTVANELLQNMIDNEETYTTHEALEASAPQVSQRTKIYPPNYSDIYNNENVMPTGEDSFYDLGKDILNYSPD